MVTYRIYLDTSVFGGCFDEEFERDSRLLFDLIEQGKFIALISEAVLRELEEAPGQVQKLLNEISSERLERTQTSAEMIALRDAYIEAKVLSAKYVEDAEHVAEATIARADALVSWNFRHLVRLDRIMGFGRVNMMAGYGPITILSPREVIADEE